MPKYTNLRDARRYCATLMTEINPETGKLYTGAARFSVGNNLYLNVAAGGINARWVFMYKFAGKQRELFIGDADVLSDEKAIAAAGQHYWTLKIDRRDPLDMRREEAAKPTIKIQTIRELIADLLDARKGGWKDPEDGVRRQWSIVNTHIPALLDMRSNEVGFDMVRVSFMPFDQKWTTQRAFLAQELLEDALNLAIKRDQITKNVAAWKGGLDGSMPKKMVAEVKGRDAMDPALVPALVTTLMADPEVEAKILLGIVLTSMREGAVSGMRPEELHLDDEQPFWTIPAERMKRKKGQEQKSFDVPLSADMVALIKAQPVHQSGLVFPSKTGKLMSNTQLNNKMRSLGLKPTEDGEVDNNDIHGFRKSMARWANNCTAHEERVIDAALGHSYTQSEVGKLAGSAKHYNDADYFEKRVPLMQDWHDHCFGRSNVTVLPSRKAA